MICPVNVSFKQELQLSMINVHSVSKEVKLEYVEWKK